MGFTDEGAIDVRSPVRGELMGYVLPGTGDDAGRFGAWAAGGEDLGLWEDPDEAVRAVEDHWFATA
jgi:hypothetical protein